MFSSLGDSGSVLKSHCDGCTILLVYLLWVNFIYVYYTSIKLLRIIFKDLVLLFVCVCVSVYLSVYRHVDSYRDPGAGV